MPPGCERSSLFEKTVLSQAACWRPIDWCYRKPAPQGWRMLPNHPPERRARSWFCESYATKATSPPISDGSRPADSPAQRLWRRNKFDASLLVDGNTSLLHLDPPPPAQDTALKTLRKSTVERSLPSNQRASCQHHHHTQVRESRRTGGVQCAWRRDCLMFAFRQLAIWLVRTSDNQAPPTPSRCPLNLQSSSSSKFGSTHFLSQER